MIEWLINLIDDLFAETSEDDESFVLEPPFIGDLFADREEAEEAIGPARLPQAAGSTSPLAAL